MRTVRHIAKDGTIVAKLDIVQHGISDLLNEKDPSYARIMAKQGTPKEILGIKKPEALKVARFIIKTYLKFILTDVIKNGYDFCYFSGRWNMIKTNQDLSKTNKLRYKEISPVKKLTMNSMSILHFLPRPLTIKYLKGFYYYCIPLGEYRKMLKNENVHGNRY